MTIAEMIEQAKTLSIAERKELAKFLIDSLDVAPPISEPVQQAEDTEPWGKRLVQVLQQTESADWGDPTIADPVEAVQAVRRQQLAHLDPYWNGGK